MMSRRAGMFPDPETAVVQAPKAFPYGLTPPGDHAVVVRALHEAQAIHRFGVNLIVVRRTVSARRAAAVQTLCASHDINIDVTIDARPFYYDQQVAAALPTDICGALGDDIASLVYWLVVLGQTSSIRLRLTTLRPLPEPEFATAHQPLRLAVTYSGFGLQWVANRSMARNDHHTREEAYSDDQRAARTAPSVIRALHPWWVAFIKGNDYPWNLGNGLVCRPSPQRTPTKRRLELTLEPVY